MASTRLFLSRANEILKILNSENICSSEYGDDAFHKRLNLIRTFVDEEIRKERMIAPGMTACVATSLMGYGLCQEFSQRFALEYVLKYKEQNVSLVCVAKPGARTDNDHMVVLIGPVINASDLVITQANCLPGSAQALDVFLSAQNGAVLVDPLFNCAGTMQNGIDPFFRFCKENELTHVLGLRPYHAVLNFAESAGLIKFNAVRIAARVKARLSSDRQQVPASQTSLFEKEPKALYQAAVEAYKNKNYRQSLHLLHKALEIFTLIRDSDSPVAFCHSTMASCYRELGDLTSAKTHAESAVALYRKLHGDTHKLTVDTQAKLAAIEALTNVCVSAPSR